MVSKKDLFSVSTAPQLLKKDTRSISDFLFEEIMQVKDTETLIVEKDLLPLEFKNNNKFSKFAPTLDLKRFRSYKDAVGFDAKMLRDDALFDNKKEILSGITYKPFTGLNTLTKKFSLTQLLKASKLYSYAPWIAEEKLFTPSSYVKPYDSARRVRRDGANVIVRVPSRQYKSKYEMKFQSTPIFDNHYALNLAMLMTTTHSCKQKEFFIRYTYEFDSERSTIYLWDAHEIAGYFSIVDHYLNPDKRDSSDSKNFTPYKMNLFGVPNYDLMTFYDNLSHNVLIKDSTDKKPRRLLNSENEILLWHAINNLGPNALNSTQKLKDYNWKI